MEPTAQDELGLPLIAGGETRMEEKAPVQYHQLGGRRRGGEGGVHDGFLVTAFAAVELDLLLVDVLRAGLLSMLLYMQFSISSLAGVVTNNNNNDDDETAAADAAAAGTTPSMMMKLWWWSSHRTTTTIAWSLIHFCTTSILYRRTVRHARTTTTTTKNNPDHSTSPSRRWTTMQSLAHVVRLWLPELIALSTIALCAIGHVEIAVILFLVGKYVMAAFAVVYWMGRSIIFFLLLLSSSSSCGRSRRQQPQCPNKPEDDEDHDDDDGDEATDDDENDDETSTTDGHDVQSSSCVHNRV
jgi:hypothetical protein